MKMRRKIYTIISLIPFVIGLVLWFCDETDLLTPGSSFSSGRWPSFVIFLLGSIICLGSIPFLYTSSYSDFKNHDKIWIIKLACMYPLFLFGIFFQIGGAYFSLITMPLSLLVVFAINLNLFILSFRRATLRKHKWYYCVSLACLAIYYTALVILQFSFELLNTMKLELRYLLQPIHMG